MANKILVESFEVTMGKLGLLPEGKAPVEAPPELTKGIEDVKSAKAADETDGAKADDSESSADDATEMADDSDESDKEDAKDEKGAASDDEDGEEDGEEKKQNRKGMFAAKRSEPKSKGFSEKFKAAMKRAEESAELPASEDRVSSMLEDTQEILKSLHLDNHTELMQSFANLAILADELAENYAFACDNATEELMAGSEINLCGCAAHLAQIASDAADTAEALESGLAEGKLQATTSPELAESFSAMMTDVTDGLDLFASLMGGELEESVAADDKIAEATALVNEISEEMESDSDFTK